MDGASVTIVLLFVIAIFSSLPNTPDSPNVIDGPLVPRSELFDDSIIPAGAYGFAEVPYSNDDTLISAEATVTVEGGVKHVFQAAGLPPPEFYSPSGKDVEAEINEFITSYAKGDNRGYAPQIASAIVKYAKEYNVNPKLLAALIARESRFNPFAVSSAGAQGLGQLMPSTAAGLKITDSFDIDQNVKGTCRYVRYLMDKWDGERMQVPLALASYLAGPNAVKQSRGLSNSTKGYVADILKVYYRI